MISKPFKTSRLAALAGALSTLALAAADGPDPASAAAAPLRVGVAPVTPPMIFKQGAKIVGVEADFAQALGKELGRGIKFVELPWEDLIDALDAGKVDIIMSSMSVTRPRAFRVAFTDPYLRVGQMLLVRANDKYRAGLLGGSLSEKTIGLRKATTGDLLAQQDFPRAKRKYFKTCDEAARALSKGKIDMYLDDSSMIWYLAGAYEAEGLTVAPLVLSDEMLAWGGAALRTAIAGSHQRFPQEGQGQRGTRQDPAPLDSTTAMRPPCLAPAALPLALVCLGAAEGAPIRAVASGLQRGATGRPSTCAGIPCGTAWRRRWGRGRRRRCSPSSRRP